MSALRSRPLLGSCRRAAGLRTPIGPSTPRRCHGVRTRRCLSVGDGVLHGHWRQPPRGSRRKDDLEEIGRATLDVRPPNTRRQNVLPPRQRPPTESQWGGPGAPGTPPARRCRCSSTSPDLTRVGVGSFSGRRALAACTGHSRRPSMPAATRSAILCLRAGGVTWATRPRRGRRNPRSPSRRRSPSSRGHAIEHELRHGAEIRLLPAYAR